MRILSIPYATWKLVLNANPTWVVYTAYDGEARDLWSGNPDYLYATRINEDLREDYDVWDNTRTVVTVVNEDEALAYLIGIGKKIHEVPRTSDGRLKTAPEKTEGDRVNFFSCDYTDATTWYPQSIRVVAEAATDLGAHTAYALSHSPIIDTYHGRLTGEDNLVNTQGQSYRVIVTVTPQGGSAIAKVEQNPHFGVGGDFTVNYDTGTITFLSPLVATDQVNVTYHWVNLALANGTASRFTVAPAPGKKLSLELAECQFSLDIEPNDSIIFEVWGIADFYLTAGQMAAYGIPYGIGYKIRLQRVVYKAFSDFQNDAFKSYPSYPAIGSSNNWRSQKEAVMIFDWDYLTSISLLSSKGMEIRIFLEHDTAFGGWMATAAFYCKSESEN